MNADVVAAYAAAVAPGVVAEFDVESAFAAASVVVEWAGAGR